MRVLELMEIPAFNGGLSSVSPGDSTSSQGKSETQPDRVEGPEQGAGPRGAGPEPPPSHAEGSQGPSVSFLGIQFCF